MNKPNQEDTGAVVVSNRSTPNGKGGALVVQGNKGKKWSIEAIAPVSDLQRVQK
ncbi:hypothetical protein [[Phormidium] sp. ETS-05]|uniref:hypothetical protein n=1 Tax=[Phormidium] sp. ETS-05 TaxID=222819 RepID=UPI0018EEFB53|nr:hypothetical protein [[Phormidium] sp. ETS-05]